MGAARPTRSSGGASLPGFGFPGPRPAGRANKDTAKAWAELMRRLGYDRYTAHAGDLGHAVSHQLGVIDSEHMAALHLTSLMAGSVNAQNVNLDDPTEKRDLEIQQRFDQELGAYAHLQMARPQSLSYALADSPVGQLAWIVERFRDWTAAKDVPEDAVDRDAMLTNVMVCWLTNTAGSTARWYGEMIRESGPFEPLSPVPTAFAIAPDDIFHPVRRLAERSANIVRWTNAGRHSRRADVAGTVWIGAGVTILPGVSIGRDAVIAAGAIMADDVPPASLVTPATRQPCTAHGDRPAEPHRTRLPAVRGPDPLELIISRAFRHTHCPASLKAARSHRRPTSAARSAQVCKSQQGFTADIWVSVHCQRPKLRDQLVAVLPGRPARVAVEFRSELIGGSLIGGDCARSEHGPQAGHIAPSQESQRSVRGHAGVLSV
ncbi:hypothetical protein [Streptomyces sp. NBC_00347]|uniref:hypothetical protein n=1 Tax=Streptomyces sp. NBC_00347 TaxID=2975721 RepID=UPI002B1CFA93|nr:hypothetical protein [Streptomyces sp. NBC_00347]